MPKWGLSSSPNGVSVPLQIGSQFLAKLGLSYLTIVLFSGMLLFGIQRRSGSYWTGKTSWQDDAFWRGNHVYCDDIAVHARFLQGGDQREHRGSSATVPVG